MDRGKHQFYTGFFGILRLNVKLTFKIPYLNYSAGKLNSISLSPVSHRFINLKLLRGAILIALLLFGFTGI